MGSNRSTAAPNTGSAISLGSGGAANPYEKAVLLQNFFLDGSFTYDLRGPARYSSLQ